IAALKQAVIDEKHGKEKAGATGISIYFPNSKLYKDEDAGAKSYSLVVSTFARRSLWEDFLAFHYTKRPLPATTAQQPTATPQAAAVSAPNAEPIKVGPVKLSATTVTRKKPVILRSTVTGDNVSFIYIFIGYQDPKTKAIHVVDLDFIEAEQTKK